MTELKGKVVLITGSSSGIGQAIAVRFAKEGAKIIINCRENQKGAEETKKAIEKLGAESLVVQADVSKPTEIKRLFDETIKQFGTVDILINNAALQLDKPPFLEASFEDIEAMVHADLIGPMICSQYAVKIMQKQGHGKILNTGSVRGWEYGGRTVLYGAAKAGLHNFTRTLAKEVAPNILVNAVAPGFVKTRIYDDRPKDMIEKFMSQTALKRFINPEEIADAFLFLAKNDAITGQIIYVDAGLMLLQ